MTATAPAGTAVTAVPARPGTAPRGRGVGTGALAAAAAGAAAVLGWWWVGTGSVVGLGGWSTGAGRITGLLAGYALPLLLSFAHVITTGAELVGHPVAAALWSALHVVAAAAVLWWRGVVPVRTAWRQRFVVERVVVEDARPVGGVVSAVLRGRDVAALGAQAGQFVSLRRLTREGWWSSHPCSLSAAPAGNLLRVTVKALGDHSASLAALAPGTRVLLAGPYGALTAEHRSRRRVLLLAGRVGGTPLRAPFQTLPASPGDLTMVVRARSEDDLVLAGELREIAARRGQHLHLLPGRSSGDADVLLGDRLARVLPDLAEHDVYVCGPPGFTDAALAALRRAGVPGRRVHAERFAL